jgi:hypothetical protein
MSSRNVPYGPPVIKFPEGGRRPGHTTEFALLAIRHVSDEIAAVMNAANGMVNWAPSLSRSVLGAGHADDGV